MATLRFSFGTMGSGKSTLALQIHHNLSARGLHGLLCTHLDREGAQVSSRLGVSVEAVDVGPLRHARIIEGLHYLRANALGGRVNFHFPRDTARD